MNKSQETILIFLNHITNPYSIIHEPEYDIVYTYLENQLINLCLQELSNADQDH